MSESKCIPQTKVAEAEEVRLLQEQRRYGDLVANVCLIVNIFFQHVAIRLQVVDAQVKRGIVEQVSAGLPDKGNPQVQRSITQLAIETKVKFGNSAGEDLPVIRIDDAVFVFIFKYILPLLVVAQVLQYIE